MGEKWYVMGFRPVSFKDEKQNRTIEGYTLFLSREPENDQIQGQECQKLFVSSQYVTYQPSVGEEVLLSFNRYGKVSSVTPC